MLLTRKRPSKARGSQKARPRTRSRAPAPKPRKSPREVVAGLEQRHLDLIGLGLIAVAVYLGCVLYVGWDGGPVGDSLKQALTDATGRVAYLVPIAVAVWGAGLMMRPMIKAPGAFNAGAILIVASLLLAFAAETAGLGPSHPVRHGYFHQPFYSVHGGVVGEGLYWAATSLFHRLGAQILAVLMFVSGVLLITQTTMSSLLKGAGKVARTAGAGTRDLAKTVRMNTGQGGFGGFEPDGRDIAVTRAGQTEPLATEALSDPEMDEAETARFADGTDWDAEEPDAPGPGQFAYEDTAPGVPEEPDEGVEADEDVPAAALTPMGNKRSAVTESDEIDYKLPGPKMLERGKVDPGPDMRDREATAKALLESLQHFGVEARLLGVVSGPHVSRYELQLAPGHEGVQSGTAPRRPGVRARLNRHPDPGAHPGQEGRRGRGAESAPQAGPPGRHLRRPPEGLLAARRVARQGRLGRGGLDRSRAACRTRSSRAPRAPESPGCINAMLCSILLHASPNEARLVLVDPKRVELNHYEQLPHLLTPVVTNPRMAANVLANLIGEMESRYAVMGEARARNLVELNRVRVKAGEAPLPHILCVIDELADLMMVAPAEVEDSIIRLAQKSRAVGIHLVLATQRPSTDVITGTIKVNIPARIAFAVASQVDSRVILDQGGAETLLGQGDMLFRPVGTSKMQRIQGAFVTEDEIAKISDHWAQAGRARVRRGAAGGARGAGARRAPRASSRPTRTTCSSEAARIVVRARPPRSR